jgi:hypothetical protein
MFLPRALVGALALLALCDGKPLVNEKSSLKQQQKPSTQKLKRPPVHLNYETIPNQFIIQFHSGASIESLNSIVQAPRNATKIVRKLAKRESTSRDAPKNDRFRKAVKQVMNARAFLDSLSQEAKKKGVQMKVVRTYDSDMMQGAQVTLTEKEMIQLSHSDLIKSVWPVVSSFVCYGMS